MTISPKPSKLPSVAWVLQNMVNFLGPVTQPITLSIATLGIVVRAMEKSINFAGLYAYFFMYVYKVLNVFILHCLYEGSIKIWVVTLTFSIMQSLPLRVSPPLPINLLLRSLLLLPPLLPSASPSITHSFSPVLHATSSSYSTPSPTPLVDKTPKDLDSGNLNSSPEPSAWSWYPLLKLASPLSVSGLYTTCIVALLLWTS